MQDVFLQLTKKSHTLNDESPSSLLFHMATNISLNHIRQRRRRGEHLSLGDKDEIVEHIACAFDVERQFTVTNMLHKIFKKEKESTLLIATLYWVDRMTLEEVAREVKLSVSGVRKRLSNLKATVKEFEGAHEDD